MVNYKEVITTFNGRGPQCQNVLEILPVSIALDYISVKHISLQCTITREVINGGFEKASIIKTM